MKKTLSFVFTFFFVLVLSLTPINVSAADISSKAGTVSITSGTLNVRKSPSTSAEVVYSLKKTPLLPLFKKREIGGRLNTQIINTDFAMPTTLKR